ncbi:MAG: hypothetical protein WBC93_01375, partial [Sulfitobacter sp.]
DDRMIASVPVGVVLLRAASRRARTIKTRKKAETHRTTEKRPSFQAGYISITEFGVSVRVGIKTQ